MYMYIHIDMNTTTSSAEPGPVYADEQNVTMLHTRYAPPRQLQMRTRAWTLGVGGQSASESCDESESTLSVRRSAECGRTTSVFAGAGPGGAVIIAARRPG